MSMPNGLQRHVLWNMDGRQWIENVHASGEGSKMFQHAVQRGLVTEIPQDKLAEFIKQITE